MPIVDTSRIRGSEFRPLMRAAFWLLVGTFGVLMYIGSQHVEAPYITTGQIATALYFAWFIIVVPFIGIIENTLLDLNNSLTVSNKKSLMYAFIPFMFVPNSVKLMSIFSFIFIILQSILCLFLTFSTFLALTLLLSYIYINLIIKLKYISEFLQKCISQIKDWIVVMMSGGGRKLAVEIATVLSGAYAAKELFRAGGGNDDDEENKRRKEAENKKHKEELEQKIEEQNKKIEEQEHRIDELEKKEDSCTVSYILPLLGGIIHSPETPYQYLCVVDICVCILLLSCFYSILQHYISVYLIDETNWLKKYPRVYNILSKIKIVSKYVVLYSFCISYLAIFSLAGLCIYTYNMH
jgi:hypothetical protein